MCPPQRRCSTSAARRPVSIDDPGLQQHLPQLLARHPISSGSDQGRRARRRQGAEEGGRLDARRRHVEDHEVAVGPRRLVVLEQHRGHAVEVVRDRRLERRCPRRASPSMVA